MNTSTCVSCGAQTLPGDRWWALMKDERRALRRQGMAGRGGRGLCDRCYKRVHASGDLVDYERRTVTFADVLDALEHDPPGPDESRRGWCRRMAPRLGMTFTALERALDRMKRGGAA